MSIGHLPALRAFESACRCGSFKAAAGELNISPSAVSHAVRRLERQLGARLFVRDGRAMRLSAEGETLMVHVERGFAELARGVAAVSSRGPQLFRLHCAPSFAAQWLAPRLPALLAAHPSLELRLAAGTDYSRFAADEFDADIIYGMPRQTGLEVVPLGEETVTPLCTPALAAKLATPSDLLNAQLIESDNKMLRWADWFALNGRAAPAGRRARFDRSFLSLAAAADGLGIALESTRLAERELASGRLVRPLAGRAEDCHYVGHRLVYPKTARRGPLAVFSRWIAVELGLAAES
jgi:DNA-binding transcriptional LysR family regulator